MSLTTKRSMSMACIVGSAIGLCVGLKFGLSPYYYMFLWFAVMVGTSLWESRPRHSGRNRKHKFRYY